MTTNTFQANLYNEESESNSVTAVAIIAGLVLGGVFTFLWNGLPLLAAVAMWPLGLAIGLIGAALVSKWLRGEPAWGLALAGQVLGVLSIGLIFAASIM
jgi:hypothetical protein